LLPGSRFLWKFSQKYSLAMIEDLACASGFQIAENFFDGKNFTPIRSGNPPNGTPAVYGEHAAGKMPAFLRMKFTILRFDSVGSTNTEALNQAKLGAGEGLCIVARRQTAGRGRHGRVWVSEPGAGLYFSLVLRPKIENRFLPLHYLNGGNCGL
jgi:hypothetical protein